MPAKTSSPNSKLALALGLNILAGIMWSPATAPQRIRVIGAPQSDETRIRQQLETFRGRPSRQIGQAQVARLLLPNPEIRSVESSLNLFGRGVVILKLQRPVARLRESKVALADDGTLFPLSRSVDKVAELSVHASMLGPTWIPAGQWPAARMAWLIQEVQRWRPDDAWRFDLDSRGVMSFQGNAKGRVIVGTPVDLQKKWARFSEEMAKQPTLLEEVAEINVSAPADIVTKR